MNLKNAFREWLLDGTVQETDGRSGDGRWKMGTSRRMVEEGGNRLEKMGGNE